MTKKPDREKNKIKVEVLPKEEVVKSDIDEAEEVQDVVDLDSLASEVKKEFTDEELLPVTILGKELTEFKSKESATPLVQYMREISRYPLLSIDQEKKLTKLLKESGDIEIAKTLVKSNLRLVVKMAMEYRFAHNNVMDLIQEGNIGLMKAVSKYDPDKGTKLSYYASWWIKSYILKFILDNFRLVKIGTTNEQKKLFYNLVKERDRLQGMGITPDVKMIAANLGVSEKSVKIMDQRLGESGGEVSIDKPIKDGSNSMFSDILADDSNLIEDDLAANQELGLLKDNLGDFVSSLKERDRDIFKKRLLSEIPPSLQLIADEYGVSRERVRQIEERLIRQLKVYMSDFIR